jgi:enamine deaminase RidA (YjgF/YER057c/UK114 family)
MKARRQALRLSATLAAVGLAGCMPARRFPGPVPESLTPVALNPANVPQLDGFSGAVKVGLTVFLSGQVALDASGRVVGADSLQVQLRQSLENLVALVRAARGLPGDVVKLTVYVVNYRPEDYKTIQSVAAEVLTAEAKPAVTVVGVSTLPLPELLVAVDGIASLRGALPDRERQQ